MSFFVIQIKNSRHYEQSEATQLIFSTKHVLDCFAKARKDEISIFRERLQFLQTSPINSF